MRICSVAARGLLSFGDFSLDLDRRLTAIVGPGGAGKSNLLRLIELCRRALESADNDSRDLRAFLAAFLAARHIGYSSRAVEVRVGFELTDPAERELIVAFVRAAIVGHILGTWTLQDTSELDGWAVREITEDKLAPLMRGEVVVSHPGTEDGVWNCAVEFTAAGHDQDEHRYQWGVLGGTRDSLVRAGDAGRLQGIDVATGLTGGPPPGDNSPPGAPEGPFSLLDLLPHEGHAVRCVLDLKLPPPEAHRRFAELAGISLTAGDPGRHLGLARPFAVIFRRTVLQTSDSRLLPSQRNGWSGGTHTLVPGGEGRLPEMLFRLKMGTPPERLRYQQIRALFARFTQGRSLEATIIQVAPELPPGSGQDIPAPELVPLVMVTVGATQPAGQDMQPEVPIEFAGAGAWEALVLASVLAGEASVVMLDEPAVALHPTLQHQVGTYLQNAAAQFIIITHSAHLLPLAPDLDDVQIARFDRDDGKATVPFVLSEARRRKMARKLRAKGNQNLPFAWRAILCEGETDVEAVTCLAERLGLELHELNVAVADCGSRDNLPDYIRFCGELGLRYLAVTDGDATKAAADPSVAANAQAVRDAARDNPAGALLVFPEDFETTLGVAKKKISLMPDVIQKAPLDETGPAELRALAAALQQLCKPEQ